MFRDDSFVGSWRELADRLGRDGALQRWAHDEPELRSVSSVDELVRLTRVGADPARADRIIGALVRLASVAGRRNDDALLLVVHLLSDVVATTSAQLADLDYDVMRVVLAELVCQIRSVDPRRPHRGWATMLKWETRKAVLAESRSTARNPEPFPVPVDSHDPVWERPRVGGAPVPHLFSEDVELSDVLAWAVRSGVDRVDIEMLAATETHRAARSCRSDVQVAGEFGVNVRTLYRRNKRTLAALRVAGAEYLRAVA